MEQPSKTAMSKRPRQRGYIYAAMEKAKDTISKSFKGDITKYHHVFQIINKRWEC